MEKAPMKPSSAVRRYDGHVDAENREENREHADEGKRYPENASRSLAVAAGGTEEGVRQPPTDRSTPGKRATVGIAADDPSVLLATEGHRFPEELRGCLVVADVPCAEVEVTQASADELACPAPARLQAGKQRLSQVGRVDVALLAERRVRVKETAVGPL
jgi:hypothetical protein